MRGTGIFTTSLLLCWAAALCPAQPDYFPLHQGNQWIYRGTGTRANQPLILEITKTAQLNGKWYSLLHGLPEGDFWIRSDEDGSLVALDEKGGTESVWYAFRAPENTEYRTSVPENCCSRAMIASRKAKYSGPVGDFETALEVDYLGVFQVGINRDLFLPYVGLIHREQSTGGPSFATYDLIYARIGGVTVMSEPELTFSLTVDQSVYTANLMPPVDPNRSIPVMTTRICLRNTTARPVELTFSSGQIYDLVIRNAKGEEVYRWSRGRFFTQAIQTIAYGPGEKNYVLIVPLATPEGTPLAAGQYVAEAYLTPGGPRAFSASAGFEIIHAM